MVGISAGIWRQKGGWMRGSHEAQLRNRWRRLRVSAVEIQILCDISLNPFAMRKTLKESYKVLGLDGGATRGIEQETCFFIFAFELKNR